MNLQLTTGSSSTDFVAAQRRTGPSDSLILGMVVIGLTLVTCLPYVYGFLSTPHDKVFMGIMLNVPDTAQYYSWARESSHSLLIEDMLTPESGQAVYFNLLWLVIGRLAGFLGLGVALTVQLVRPFIDAFFLCAIFWFVCRLTSDRIQRWVGFLTVVLGSGLAWTLLISKLFQSNVAFPLDLYTYEPNTFLTLLAFPHQAMADGLLVLVLGTAAIAFERGSFRLAAVAGLLALTLALQHGYDLVIVYAVLGVVALTLSIQGKRRLQPLALYATIGILSAPGGAYMLYVTRVSPIWRGVLAQYGNAGVFSPQPAHLLLVMGLPLVLIVLSRNPLQGHEHLAARELILRSWLVAGCLILYLPVNFQIKLIGGWQIPVGIVSARILLYQVAPTLNRAIRLVKCPRNLVLGLLIAVTIIPTNAYLYAWRFVDLSRHDYPYYLYRDEVGAMQWLDAHTRRSDVVLSSLTVGQYIPSLAGDHAFLAHWSETLDFYNKGRMVTEFFDPNWSDRDRLQILSGYYVTYVFYGPEERRLGSYDPSLASYLTKVYVSPRATIYQVQEPLVVSPTEQ